MTTQDEAFEEWYGTLPLHCHPYKVAYRCGWDASHEHDEELIGAYRELAAGLESFLGDDTSLEESWAATKAARDKIKELEADDGQDE